MKYSRFRTLLFTFFLGLAVTFFYGSLSEYLEEIPVDVPKIESEAPIIIRLCPEPLTQEEADKFYKKHHYNYVRKSKYINCSAGGGGA